MEDSDKYEKSIRIYKIATKEDAMRLGLKEGEKYPVLREPRNLTEAIERFKKLEAQRLFEAARRQYFKKYGTLNTKIIKDELDEINSFIEESNKLSTIETFKSGNTYLSHQDYLRIKRKHNDPSEYNRNLREYSKLSNGYYENPNRHYYSFYSYFEGNSALVYGKYILYKKWLEDELVKLNNSKNAVTSKINALFQFIDYLHSNIENFNQYNDLIKEVEQLDKERGGLKPEQNYKDRQRYNEVQSEIESKFDIVQIGTANLIKAKARELNVCSFDDEPNYSFNGIETEIRQLKNNFSNEDLYEIFKHKSQYIEFRSQTHSTFLSLQFFFSELDEISKSLFDYFKDTKQDEFEPFETKAIPADSALEVVRGLKKGQTKFTLPNSVLLNPSQAHQQPQGQVLSHQQSSTLPFSKLDFTRSKLEPFVLDLANLNGYNDPTIYLDEKLEQVEQFNSFDLKAEFYLTIHHLCQENASKFGVQSHREKISEWLNKAPIITDVFETTWKSVKSQQTKKSKSEPKETELSEKIKKYFGFFNRNCPRKHKQILKDADFEKLIEWTVWYFENDFKVPEILEPIKVVNTNKTFVQLAFKYLFKELHKSSPYPKTLFEFYRRAFTPYSGDKKSNFEAVANKYEVKKLMQIDC